MKYVFELHLIKNGERQPDPCHVVYMLSETALSEACHKLDYSVDYSQRLTKDPFVFEDDVRVEVHDWESAAERLERYGESVCVGPLLPPKDLDYYVFIEPIELK